MSRRSDWTGISGRAAVGLVLGLLCVAVIFAALTAALISVPGMPLWPVLASCIIALVALSAATAVAAAWHSPESADARQLVDALPPIRHAERYAADPRDWQTLTWHALSPDRPSAERPRPGLTWHCPVVPGKPRTVRDLREGPPVNLRSWE